ncbi:MAG: 4Fe-4S dicluster domain-containing protein [Pseudomonadota bacterium]
MQSNSTPIKPTFLFNANLCTGCHACSVACKDKHDLPIGLLYRRVREHGGGQWTIGPDTTFTQDIFAYYISMSCNHCEDAACLLACPSGAMQKDEHGVVFIDQNLCIACGRCAKACPYDAPQMDNERKKMRKCDFCRDELALGKMPVCVAACPCRALDFGSYDVMAERYDDVPVMEPLLNPEMTKPHFFCLPHRHAKNFL